MPGIHGSHRTQTQRGRTTTAPRRRRRSGKDAYVTRTAAWQEMLELPLAMQRRELMLVGIVLVAGWGSLFAATLSALS